MKKKLFFMLKKKELDGKGKNEFNQIKLDKKY